MSPTASHPVMDLRMRAAVWSVALTGGVLALGSAAFFGGRVGLSTALGGAVAVGNLLALAKIVGEVLPTDSKIAESSSRAGWALVLVLKMLALFAAVWALVSHHLADPIPMAVGFVSLPIGVAISSLVSDRTAARSDSTTKGHEGPDTV